MDALNLLSTSFDAVLVLGLLWLAWQALNSAELFRAIVMFIAFGLLMALAWVRLQAPDIALAEAAIGAGLTGALLLAALARLAPPQRADAHSAPMHWLVISLLLILAGGLIYGLLALPIHAPGLSRPVAEQLSASGVSNPVTAVLLNFRGYDTLLEMMVLLLALLGVWSLTAGSRTEEEPPAGIMLDTLARLLTPLLLLVAAYLLWVGAHAPGGAFQAGSVLAAAGVLLLLAGWRPRGLFRGWRLRLMLVLGPAVFVIMALGTLLLQGQMLQLPPAQAGQLILLLETAATLSIGVTLAALFLGTEPETGP